MENKKSVAVCGQGFVGGSFTTGMSHAFDVYVYDIAGKVAPGGIDVIPKSNESSIRVRPRSITEFVELCEKQDNFLGIFVVCLPTPMFEDGECDTTIVSNVLLEMSKIPGSRIAMIKSTVPPGTTERWNKEFEGTGLKIVFNPEFLREASALEDFKNQNRIVLGGPKPACNKVRDMYKEAFPQVKIVKTSAVNAEMNKYVINTFLATKVSYANEIYQICEALKLNGQDVDYDRIIEIASLDERIGTSHWQVPGPMPDDRTGKLVLGFGGSCFVKDLNTLLCLAKSLNVDSKVLAATWEKNLEVRPQADWIALQGRAVSKREKGEK